MNTNKKARIIRNAARLIISLLLLGGLGICTKLAVEACPTILYILSVNRTGGGVVRMDPPGRLLLDASGAMSYYAGAQVTLTASPPERFVCWEGAATGTTNPITITMDDNKSVTARFQETSYPIVTTIYRVSTVNPTSYGTCYYGVVFSEDVDENTVDANDFSVTHIGGVSGASVQLIMNDSPDGPNGELHSYRYIVVVGTGTGCGALRLDLVDNNTIVDAQQNPLGGPGVQNFTAGEIFGIGSTALMLTTQGSGTATASAYTCGGDVTITATPDAPTFGGQFLYWLGDVTGSTNPVTIPMTTHKTVKAVFTQLYGLTAYVTGQGSVATTNSPKPPLVLQDGDTRMCLPGTEPILTANPAAGYCFAGWTGAYTGCDNPITITMNGYETVTANFVAPIVFPDANLNAAVRQAINKPTGDITPCDVADLTELDASGHNIVNLWGLDRCTALTDLDLDNNNIVSILPLLFNPDLGPGVTISLQNNPLGQAAACLHVGQLEGLGVNVIHTEPLECAMQAPSYDPTTDVNDTDGDGVLNKDEWAYFRRYYGSREQTMQAYIPAVYTADYGISTNETCLEDVSVTIDIEGNGNVFPGEGTWNFAKYAPFSCETCTPPACDINSVTLTAVPEPDWPFRRWNGPFGEELSTELTLEMSEATGVRAEFLYRPGMADLDFMGDLDTFLLAIGYIAESMAPGLYEYDAGETEWAPDGVGGSTLELRPNGIPDAVELSLLQYVLQHVQFDMISTGGASHIHTWRSWEANLALAVSQIDNPQLDYLARLVAAYMTLGTPGHQAAMVKLVDEYYAVSLDAAVYDTSVTTWFGEHGDLDGDGVWNIEEWENVEEALDGTGTPEQIVEETTSSATDPEDEYQPPPPAEGTFDYNGDVITTGSTEHLALIADATGANGPLQKGTVTFQSGGANLTMEAFIINPSGFDSVPMPIGTAFTCALGREFRVNVKGDTRWFKTWSAGNTLINGSPSTSETFTLGNTSQQVAPGRRDEIEITIIGGYVDWSGVGPLADAIWTSQSGGNTVVHVADGTFLRVSIADTAPPPLGTNAAGLKVDGQTTYRSSLTVGGGDFTVEASTYYSGMPLWTHQLSGDGGVKVFGLPEHPSSYTHGYICGAVTDVGAPPEAEEFDQSFYAVFNAQPGFQHETVSRPLEGTQCASDILSIPWDGGVCAHATLATGPGGTGATTKKKSTLTAKVKVAGGCSKSSAEAAHFSGFNLTKYYNRVTSCQSTTQLVTLTAIPHCGFYLKRWTGNAVLCDSSGNPRSDKSLGAPETQTSQWVTDATIYVKCPQNSFLFAVVEMPPFAITSPDNNPATIDNHKTFDTASPAVCRITATCNECCPDNIEWEISGLNNPTMELTTCGVRWTVTGLPQNNSGFGKKTITATRKCGCGSDTREVELFFPGADNARNHPGGGDSCTGVPEISSNWYYYWKQTSADYSISHCYGGSYKNTGVTWDPSTNIWYVVLDQGCNDLYPHAYPLGTTNGIDTYAWDVRHEAAHMADFPTWWPNGLPDPNLPPIDPPDPNQRRDRDGDGMPDHVEAGLGWDYSDPFSQHPPYLDSDWYAMTIRNIPWTPGAAMQEDWSDNGQQSNI